MCGGAGTRLGPISRNALPKQLGKRSTFQDTVLRLRHKLFEHPILLTNRDYRVLAEKQLAEIDAEADIVMEPERLENGGIEPLELIVVQNRSDLGEDDAIRADETAWRL
jgi:mannose-1-phosphate guanylyltransferase